MWTVLETKAASKALDRATREVRKNYDAWLQIVRLHGPAGLRAIKGFHDEALGGEWKGYRSSRLNRKWRVLYKGERSRGHGRGRRRECTRLQKEGIAMAAIRKATSRDLVPARVRTRMTPGEMLQIVRKLQEMTQAALAAASGVPQPAISAIESGRQELGTDRARRLAAALRVHPAVLLFPDWDAADSVAATA